MFFCIVGKAHKHGDTTPGPGLDMGNVHVESPPTTLTGIPVTK